MRPKVRIDVDAIAAALIRQSERDMIRLVQMEHLPREMNQPDKITFHRTDSCPLPQLIFVSNGGLLRIGGNLRHNVPSYCLEDTIMKTSK